MPLLCCQVGAKTDLERSNAAVVRQLQDLVSSSLEVSTVHGIKLAHVMLEGTLAGYTQPSPAQLQ